MTRTDQRKSLRGVMCVASVLVVASCDVTPEFLTPSFAFGPSYVAKTSGLPVPQEEVAWWTRFNDPTLNALVEEALAGNLDLAVAKERVKEAQALARSVPESVTVTGTVRAGREGGRDISDANGGDGTFGFDWLLDPWGGRAAELRGAQGEIDVAEAELDAARLLLLSNIATAYIDLRFQQRSVQLRRAELESRKTTLDLIKQLQASGVATRLDIVRSEALVSETRSLIPRSEAAVRIQQNRIATLLGKTSGAPDGRLVSSGKGQPLAGVRADIGIPADLLRNRPDLRVAERLYYVAVADVGVRTAELYPSLSISGEISLSSYGGTKASDYFFGPTLRLPALPEGSRRARVEAQQSRANQALTRWQSDVLGAVEEVENSLVNYSGSLASANSSRDTVRLYRESVELTRGLVGREGATVRDLLDAEQSVATANFLLSQNLRNLGTDFVTLNVSLGAGHGYGGKPAD
ncbi:efflux transporter outer membrane subunit [uncultured Shimia sp.]|uniref:efflux transporter outer membrane subunit n=1 Tax=uncultured Shimia sp. TaxID=573152 RepID=UPI0026309745|nr:efflux transporter outer membrane subunit [uncultured Shimia sp.]